MLRLTDRGRIMLEVIRKLSESDIRLLSWVAREKIVVEKSVQGAEYLGYSRVQVQRLQMLGFIKGEGK